MDNDDVCCCKEFGVTCLVVLTHSKGKLILLNEQCASIAYFKDKDKRFLATKHQLSKGGDLCVRD